MIEKKTNSRIHSPIPVTQSIRAVSSAISNDDQDSLRLLLKTLNPAEIAHIVDALPINHRTHLLEHLPDLIDGEVLLHMGEAAASELVEELDVEALHHATKSMDTADVAELFDEVL